MANPECTVETETRTQRDIEYVCTLDDSGKLIWMDRESSEKLAEERKQAEEAQRQAEEAATAAEAQRQVEEAVAAEEAQRQAEEAVAAAQAQRQAEEAAAAAEAERQAEERAREQQQPPADTFTYPNCTAVQEPR